MLTPGSQSLGFSFQYTVGGTVVLPIEYLANNIWKAERKPISSKDPVYGLSFYPCIYFYLLI